MTAAMLLTLAWMTGCDSGKTAESSKAATTTALETTAEVVTDAAETTAAEESSAADARALLTTMQILPQRWQNSIRN